MRRIGPAAEPLGVSSWRRAVAELERQLGPVHAETVDARERLAYSYRMAGYVRDEIAIVEQIAADHERLLGRTHPRTLRAQVQLAARYWEGNASNEGAIQLGENIINAVYEILGPDHEDARLLRSTLVLAYMKAERADDATALLAQYQHLDGPRDSDH